MANEGIELSVIGGKVDVFEVFITPSLAGTGGRAGKRASQGQRTVVDGKRGTCRGIRRSEMTSSTGLWRPLTYSASPGTEHIYY